MDLQCIDYEVLGSWARVTLNRPDKLNALSDRLLAELNQVLWEADDDRDVHAVLLRGAGRAFCAGYDLTDDRRTAVRLRESATGHRGYRKIGDDTWQMERYQRAMMTLFDMHKPVVAQVHGFCLAGGMDLAMLCDIVMAAEDATFGFPPARGLGTLPINMWLWNVPVQWAKRLLLTGDRLSGIDAARIGMVVDAFPADELESECVRLVEKIALTDPEVLAVNKRSLNLAMELAGARTLQRLAVGLDAAGHKADQAQEFFQLIREIGVGAASRKRDERYGDDDMIAIRHH